MSHPLGLAAEPADEVVEGRVEAVLGPTRLALRALTGTRVLAFEAPHGLAVGDLLRAGCRANEPASLLSHARTHAAHPLLNDDLRRLGTPRALEGLRQRARAQRVVRDLFADMGFTEVETPSVVLNPGMDPHLVAPQVTGFTHPHGESRWLGTSPELHMKRLLAAGHSRIFQLARCYRAGELGARHQPEFTMLEWYRGWASLPSVMRDAEAIVRGVCDLGRGPIARRDGRELRLDAPFETLTIREAFARYCPEERDPIALAARDEARYYELLGSRVEPSLGWERGVFLTRFPSCHASLARVCEDDPSVCHRAELYVAGLELCNAFDELTDPREQRARFEADQRARAAMASPVYPIDERFMSAMELGLPPSAGNAMGFDRLLMLALGADSIDEVLTFAHGA